MKPVLVLKDASVRPMEGTQQLQMTFGPSKYGIRELAGAAFGPRRSLGTRLAAMGDLAGRGFAAAATAQQVAEQAQSGRGAEAYLGAPAQYRANIPVSFTGNMESLSAQPRPPAPTPDTTPTYDRSRNIFPMTGLSMDYYSTNQRAGGAQYNPQQNIFPQATLGAMGQQAQTQQGGTPAPPVPPTDPHQTSLFQFPQTPTPAPPQYAPAPVTAPTQPVMVQPPVTAPTAPQQQPQQPQQQQPQQQPQQGQGAGLMPPRDPNLMPPQYTGKSADPFTHALNYLLKRLG